MFDKLIVVIYNSIVTTNQQPKGKEMTETEKQPDIAEENTADDTASKGAQHEDIHAAMLAVMHEVGYVKKSGKFDSGKIKYNFAGEADFISAIRPVMIEHGITFRVTDITDLQRDRYEKISYYNGNEQKQIQFKVSGIWHFEFTHAPTGGSVKAVGLGDGVDALDKASYKAATGALKYALRQSFLIETGDDPDKPITKEEREKEARQQQGQAEFQKLKAQMEGWAAKYMAALDGCQTKNDFFALKNDAGKKKWLDAIEGKVPELRAQIKVKGQDAARRLSITKEEMDVAATPPTQAAQPPAQQPPAQQPVQAHPANASGPAADGLDDEIPF